jgi:hypothetical protein
MYMQSSCDASTFLFDPSKSWTENYRLRACAIATASDREILEPSDDPEEEAVVAQWERDCAAETLRNWESDHADTGEWKPDERHYTPKSVHKARPLSPEDRRRFEQLDAWAHAAAVRAFVEFEARNLINRPRRSTPNSSTSKTQTLTGMKRRSAGTRIAMLCCYHRGSASSFRHGIICSAIL